MNNLTKVDCSLCPKSDVCEKQKLLKDLFDKISEIPINDPFEVSIKCKSFLDLKMNNFIPIPNKLQQSNIIDIPNKINNPIPNCRYGITLYGVIPTDFKLNNIKED